MRDPRTNYIDHILIFLIIVIGAILRFYDYTDIPFTHDEFSALFRTGFSNFHDLILKGVETDTHPAGVQVFLYYWVKLTGFSEPLVKLPFTLLSLGSVYLVYLTGRKWFSATSGLLAASFLSFLQYPVMYGQIARPYASGLFLVLLMVYFWTNLMHTPSKRYYFNLAGYILSSALCAYNHHFTLLFCGLAGFTGLFIVSRERRLTYILSWFVITLLYIPHLSIFLGQLKQGGIGGWLSKPRPDFILDYLSYVFQFSWVVVSMIILLVILALVWRDRESKTDYRFVLVSLIWFLIPLITAFLYSIWINPVLQYSVLIFSFPFLLLLLFFYAGAKRAWQKIVLVGLCAATIIPSLISERKHYSLFYHSPYREIIVQANHAADSLGRSNCFIFLDSYRKFTEYYLTKPGLQDLRINYVHDVLEPAVISRIIDTCVARYFIYGCISNSQWTDYQIIRSKYPTLLIHTRLNEGDFYVFSRDSRPVVNEYYFTADGVDLTTPVFSMDSSLEFGPSFRGSLRDICRHKNDIIDVCAEVETGQAFTEAYLQLGIYQQENLLCFQSTTIQSGSTGIFRKVYCSYRLADIEWRHHNLKFQAFIWNPKRQNLMIRGMSVRFRQGNPFLYGLYRKIEK